MKVWLDLESIVLPDGSGVDLYKLRAEIQQELLRLMNSAGLTNPLPLPPASQAAAKARRISSAVKGGTRE